MCTHENTRICCVCVWCIACDLIFTSIYLYSSKAPKMSATYKQATVNVLKSADPDSSTKSNVTKTILKSHGAIDRGPAEWCHFICSTNTCQIRCRNEDGNIGNLRMVRVSLKGGKRIKMDHTQDEEQERQPTDFVALDSVGDAYARRKTVMAWTSIYPEIMQLNLRDFVKDWVFAEKKLIQKLTTKVFVSFYPSGSSDYRVGDEIHA